MFSLITWKKFLNRYVFNFSVNYTITDSSNINIRIYLRTITYKMFVIIKSIFIVLAASTVNASNHTKRVCLSNQKYEVQPSLINLHPNEYNHELHYYPFVVKLDKCAGSCHTWIKNFNKIYHAKNHIKDHIKECNSDQWWNISKCLCECKKCHVCKKDYLWNPASCNEKYLIFSKYQGWFRNCMWWSYRNISQRNKNYSNKF